MRTTPHTRWLCCIPAEGAVTALGYFQARRPGFVLTYFVISLLVALALASFMLYCIFNYPQYTYEDGFIEASLALLVYFPCLAIVLLVYRDMAAESSNKIYNELQKNNYYGHEVMKKAVV